MIALPAIVFLMCAATSVLCLALLVRAYRRSPTRLLRWSAICFVFLATSNGLLFLDIVIWPEVDLVLLRHIATLLAVATLLYGFIWDVE